MFLLHKKYFEIQSKLKKLISANLFLVAFQNVPSLPDGGDTNRWYLENKNLLNTILGILK